MITSDQVKHFWDTGYLVVDDVFSADEVEQLRKATDAPAIKSVQAERGVDEKLLHVLELTARHPAFLALARDQRLVTIVRALMGDNLQLHHSKLTTKPPVQGRGSCPWHQDFGFFPHTNTDLLALGVLLDDATEDNGCVSVIPGSHKLGPLDHAEEGYFSGRCVEESKFPNVDDAVPMTTRAGGITIHHCLTLHSSPENISGNPRRMAVYQYRAADAYQLAAHIWIDTGLHISGHTTDAVRCDNIKAYLPRRQGQEQPFDTAWNQEGGFARAENMRKV